MLDGIKLNSVFTAAVIAKDESERGLIDSGILSRAWYQDLLPPTSVFTGALQELVVQLPFS